MSRSWLLHLDEVIESAEKIERFVSGRTPEEISIDEVVFDALLFNLQSIGEAMSKIPVEARDSLPEADDSLPAHVREMIARHYFSLDPEIVWELCNTRVPRLLAQACALRDEVECGAPSAAD